MQLASVCQTPHNLPTSPLPKDVVLEKGEIDSFKLQHRTPTAENGVPHAFLSPLAVVRSMVKSHRETFRQS